MRIARTICAPVLLCLFFISGSASAYTTWKCQNGSPAGVVVYLDLKWPSTTPGEPAQVDFWIRQGSAAEVTAMQEVFDDYAAVGALVRPRPIFHTENFVMVKPSNVGIETDDDRVDLFEDSFQPGDGFNDIAWTDLTTTAGQAFINASCNTGHILEADIVLHSSSTRPVSFQKTKSGKRAYTKFDPFAPLANAKLLHNLLTHELGHALGFAHTGNTYNIMGDDDTHIHANGSVLTPTIGEDLSNGLRVLYGSDATAPSDISIVHWNWIGRLPGDHGGYSIHDRTTANAARFSNFVELEPIYIMGPGETYIVNMTHENQGKDVKVFSVGIYLSTNDFISIDDRRIGGFDLTTIPNTVDTWGTFVTIPADVTAGTYWLGFIADENFAYAERTKANNATYFAQIKVPLPPPPKIRPF